MANTKTIDLQAAEELASLGLTEQQIANSLGISRSTLSRRKVDDATFDTALRKGVDHATAEICLAHTVGSAVERSYRRGDLLKKRRVAMQTWANYACATPQSKVVSITG